MPAETYLFQCLSDNYGVLLHDPQSGATASIDAPDARPIEAALRETGWRLTDILVTHHHADHTGGITELKEKHGCRVVAPKREADKIPDVDETVSQGHDVKVGNLQARVLDTPGHTSGHVSYIFDANKLAFVGDTLFALGCGRVIEGTPAQMWNSLKKLRELPDDMSFFCGHEYTAANARFALTIEPNNTALQERAAKVEQLRKENRATLPATLGEEKATNPFLRADIASVAAAVGLPAKDPAAVFAEIRLRKNKF